MPVTGGISSGLVVGISDANSTGGLGDPRLVLAATLESGAEAVYLDGIEMECDPMVAATKRKTSLTLDAEALDRAKALGINVSAVAEAALMKAVAESRRRKWLDENAEAFAAQSDWHERHGHPLADIIAAPGASSWSS